ncbi:MAG: hypothetical protein C4339_06335 [Nitrososphaerota archaeon]
MRLSPSALYTLLLLAILLALSQLTRDEYALQTLTGALQMALFAYSWMLLAYSGQVSLGHAFFFGVGAYSSVLLSLGPLGSPLPALFVGPLLSGLLGLAVGLLGARLREWFLGMYTFGLSVIAQTLALSDQLAWLTNGAYGLFPPALLPGLSYSSGLHYYYLLSAALVTATYLLTRLILGSGLGLTLSSIHDNEAAASSVGVNVKRYRTLIFGLSGYMAGLAGALNRLTLVRYLDPSIFGLENSVWPLLLSVVGGMRYAEGPLAGALLLIPLAELLRNSLGGFLALATFGLLLGLVILSSPAGLYPLVARWALRLAPRGGVRLGAAPRD